MYTVRFYKGDYLARQQKANEDECTAYVEHHFNSSPSATAGYSLVVTGYNASQTSRNWGRWYSAAVAREFDIPLGGDEGIVVGGYSGQGDFNLKHTKMPAILLEPLFASNPRHTEWIRSKQGQERLARVLCESIHRFFQDGGLIGFSVGHKYKESRPKDRGASVIGGGTEADYAEAVLKKAKKMLEEIKEPQTEREIRVMINGEITWAQTIDADAEVSWDPARGLLRIEDS